MLDTLKIIANCLSQNTLASISAETLFLTVTSPTVISIYKKNPDILKQVVFEVTEDGECLMRIWSNQTNLTKLSDLGVRVAIDDLVLATQAWILWDSFRSVFSRSIACLWKHFGRIEPGIPLPFEPMLQLSRTLGMQVIVEGVEYESQVNILSKLGVDYIQGFYFYKPMPINLTISLLRQQYVDSSHHQASSLSKTALEQPQIESRSLVTIWRLVPLPK